ncbi:hypothetical protein SNEBB_002587 [Seison nebaliae]|nr:hypothetical protein SNEBB_002587 [Seison nebaliae]
MKLKLEKFEGVLMKIRFVKGTVQSGVSRFVGRMKTEEKEKAKPNEEDEGKMDNFEDETKIGPPSIEFERRNVSKHQVKFNTSVEEIDKDEGEEGITFDVEMSQAARQRTKSVAYVDLHLKPHTMFCEMDVFSKNEWKEVARWVKFEENVELSGRWSKPHVATLFLSSVFEMRYCFEKGALLLDSEAETIDDITEEIMDVWAAKKLLKAEYREPIKELMMKRHIHQHEKEYKKVLENESGEKRTTHHPHLFHKHDKHNDHTDRGNSSTAITKMADHNKSTAMRNHTTIGIANIVADSLKGGESKSKGLSEENHGKSKHSKEKNLHLNTHLQPEDSSASLRHHSRPSFSDLMHHFHLHHNTSNSQFNEPFMKKLKKDSEAANILIGELKELKDTYLVAFIRLKEAQNLPGLTEIPIPTRFMFILLTPIGKEKQYFELGRAASTLLSDALFIDIAYQATYRKQILAGIDEFLGSSIVLPPGEWDPEKRIEPPDNLPERYERLKDILHNFTSADTKLMHNNSSAAFEKSYGAGGTGDGGNPDDDDDDPHRKKNGKVFESKEEEDGLVRTGRFAGGLIDDIKRKKEFYWSDFRDALSIQTISTIIFMYFACLAPIVTFGGLMGQETNNYMAAIESLVAGALCGMVYHMCSGQPLTILGSTGPVLVFESIIYRFTHDVGLDFLSFRCCIGLWCMVILLVIVLTDMSYFVKYITRFTEESFATLIALIFIKESLKKLIHINDDYTFHINTIAHDGITPHNIDSEYNGLDINGTLSRARRSATPMQLNCTCSYLNYTTKDSCLESGAEWECVKVKNYVPDIFLFSCVLFASTYFISVILKGMKTSRMFPQAVRNCISNFAVVIAIGGNVLFDALVGINTPKLLVPSTFRTTRRDRNWLINPLGKNQWWSCLAAIIPALLLTILIYMDQHITAVIVNRRENKLKKGSGYHLDLLCVAVCIGICSCFGIPYFVAATVISINHVLSLKLESKCAAPGEKPHFTGVIEQRVTGVIVFLFIGLSVFLTRILSYIPMPVLYGVFLYMGTSSLKGNQLFDRMKLFFMPTKYQPDYIYLRHVTLSRVHLFTGIQLACLAILWTVKSFHTSSIAFPLMVLALVGVRKLLDYFFTLNDLSYLDDVMPEQHKLEDDDLEPENSTNSMPIDLRHVVVGSGLYDRAKTNLPFVEVEQSTPKQSRLMSFRGNLLQRMRRTSTAEPVVAVKGTGGKRKQRTNTIDNATTLNWGGQIDESVNKPLIATNSPPNTSIGRRRFGSTDGSHV